MNPLTREQIRGTWGTVLLPVDEDEQINFSRLAGELDYLLASGLDGIYTNGTAGEFYAQSEEEFDRIHTLVAEICERARMPFQIGVSHMSAQISLQRAMRAARWRPGALQVILPDWSAVTGEEALAFLHRIAEAVEPIPLVLYNPPHAKRVLTPEACGKLSRSVPALVGLKVAGGDRAWYGAMRAAAPRLSLFVPGHVLATGIQHGAAGSYSNVACLQPVGAKKWNDLMERDLGAALEIEARLNRFFDEHIFPLARRHGYSNQALDKLLAAIGGWAEIGTRLRWPYGWVDESAVAGLRVTARRYVPELLEM